MAAPTISVEGTKTPRKATNFRTTFQSFSFWLPHGSHGNSAYRFDLVAVRV